MEKSRVKIHEMCKISPTPCLNSNNVSSNFSLPISSFDWLFINIPPTDRVFYYKLADSDPSLFLESIIPNLKQSLSLTLQHFLPLSGNLVWPENSPKPFILYSPPNDSVSFTVAEIHHDSDFISNPFHDIKHPQILIPTLQSSDFKTPLMAIQVTKFPNHDHGFSFSIATSCHHVIFDGKSMNLFMKAWSHISKFNSNLLPDSLTPSFERSSNIVLNENPPSVFNQRQSLKFLSFFVSPSDYNLFHATFELTKSHIEKLKIRVLDSMEKNKNKKFSSRSEDFHLSTLVVAYAYTISCFVKVKRFEDEEKIGIGLTADARPLLNPPVSSNYFGNCLGLNIGIIQGKEISGEGDEEVGFFNIAKKISDIILGFKRSEIKASNNYLVGNNTNNMGIKYYLVCGSPKFKFYETDFGWGKPEKIEIVSLRTNNISLSDARDGGDGIEIGVVLPSHEMDLFASLFSKGLN